MPSASMEDLVRELGGRQSGSGWMVHCPSHDDRTPSLTLKEGESGKVLLKCHAGCSNIEVISELRQLGLWPVRDSRNTPVFHTTHLEKTKLPHIFETLQEVIQFLEKGKKDSRATIYHYSPTESGVEWGIVRLDFRDGKTFRPFHRGKGGFLLLDPPGLLTLFYVDRLDPSLPVYVVEGEKCVLALESLGKQAVTSAHGAHSAQKSDWSPLSGKKVILWPDKDQSGIRYAETVREILQSLNPKPFIKTIDVEKMVSLSEGQDAADWCAKGGTSEFLEALPIAHEPEHPNGSPEDDPHLHFTDLGNARRMVWDHGQNIRYVPVWKKWLFWNGTYWETDETGEIERRAKKTVLRIPLEARSWIEQLSFTANGEERTKFGDRIKQVLSWSKKSESRDRIRAMIDLTQTEDGIPTLPDRLDSDPYLLGVKNGVIDLRTGNLRKARREDYITKTADVVYDPNARFPVFQSFLQRIQPDPEIRKFLQRWFGYSLTGNTGEHCLVIFYGTGRNGKSTVVDTMLNILGGWARQADFRTFSLKEGDGARNDLARLFRTRMVAATEGQDNTRLDEAVIKALTGGDRITARFLYSEFFEYSPTFKLILSTNHRPQIRGTDEGIWSRIRLVPFAVTIPEAERDKNLKDKLIAESSGILNWLIAGCLDWKRYGLEIPESVKAATGEYRESQDLVGRWIVERCRIQPREKTFLKTLYEDFCSWTEGEGIERTPVKRKFSESLVEKGFEKIRVGNDRSWGFNRIGLNPADKADIADQFSGNFSINFSRDRDFSENQSALSAKSANEEIIIGKENHEDGISVEDTDL